MKTSFLFFLFFFAICNDVLYANYVEKKRTSGNEDYHKLKRAKHGEHIKLIDEAHNYMVKQNGGVAPVNLQPIRSKLSHKASKHTEDIALLRAGDKLPGPKNPQHFEQKLAKIEAGHDPKESHEQVL